MSKRKDYLLLKWGSLKDWSGVNNPKALKLIDEWIKLGVSWSAMMHRDTPKQKKILCDVIDNIDGKIQNDWDGKFYTKKQAKKYILEYGNE